MFEPFLVTTSSDGLQPLGSAAQRSWELVTSAVRARLGPEHAALFAEPVASPHGERIDWHAPMPGRAVPLNDLPDADRTWLRARLGALAGDVRVQAQALGETGNAEDQRLSEALLNALEIPGEAMIWAVRDAQGDLHPVLVHWAWTGNRQKAVRGILTGLVARSAPAIATSTVTRRAPFWNWLIGLGWLVLAMMLGAILWLLVAPCGLNPVGPDRCPGDDPALVAAFAEEAVIADQIAALERGLALAERSCQPSVPILPAPQRQGAGDPGDIATRLAARGAASGALNFALDGQGRSDLDLAVTCPSWETLSRDARSACGGRLDLDANANVGTALDEPPENIVLRDAKPGIYKVRAHLRQAGAPGDLALALHVLRDGAEPQSHPGTVIRGGADWTVNISISR